MRTHHTSLHFFADPQLVVECKRHPNHPDRCLLTVGSTSGDASLYVSGPWSTVRDLIVRMGEAVVAAELAPVAESEVAA